MRAVSVYFKNVEFNKNLVKFAEFTADFIFTLNNRKYPQISVNKNTSYSDFLNDFSEYVDLSDNFVLSLLPANVVKNIFQVTQFVR